MVLVILIILFTVFSSYPISAGDVLKNTTAVPIDHAVTDGEHFVNNIIHGQKLNSIPDYLIFTAPYRLCGGECQGKDDNFAMVFPLFVGNKGKAKYKDMYQRDYKNLHQKRSRAPFRVKTTRRPYTLCPTLKSTEETTTTSPVETTTTTPVKPTTTTSVESKTATPVEMTTTTSVEPTTTTPVEPTTTAPVETTTESIALPASAEILSNSPICPHIPPGMCKYRNSNKVTFTGKIKTLSTSKEAESKESDYDLTSSINLQRTRKYSTVSDYLYDSY